MLGLLCLIVAGCRDGSDRKADADAPAASAAQGDFFDGHPRYDPAYIPGGLPLANEMPPAPAQVPPIHHRLYAPPRQPAADDPRALIVSVIYGPLPPPEEQGSSAPVAMEVGSRPASYMPPENPTSPVTNWGRLRFSPSSGVTVEVSGRDLSLEEIQRVAESIAPA